MKNSLDSKKEIQNIRKELGKQKETVKNIDDLAMKKIEREAGIWEYDFDELEAEIWRRFSNLEKNCDCISDENQFFEKRKPNSRFHKVKERYRVISEPFIRIKMEEDGRFNLDKQNFVNKEYIPFNLAVILTLQKMKDRINNLEEMTRNLIKDQEELLSKYFRNNSFVKEEKEESLDE